MADFDEEEHQYDIRHDGSPDRKPSIAMHTGTIAKGEAAALYGDVETAESEYRQRRCHAARC